MDPFLGLGVAAVATASFCIKLHNSYLERITREKTEELLAARTTALNNRRVAAAKLAVPIRNRQRMFVKEHPPEITRLKNLVKTFDENEFKWDALIAIADIYRRGAFPRFLPNELLAIKLYKLAATCPDGDVAGTAQVRYIEARDEPIAAADKAGVPLPTEYAENVIRVASLRIQGTPFGAFQKPRVKKIAPGIGTGTRVPATVIHGDAATGRIRPVGAAATTIPIGAAYLIDSQNVHDHGVTKTIAGNLDKLIAAVGGTVKNTSTVVQQVREAVLKHPEIDSGVISDALATLSSLSSTTVESIGKSETDTLRLVWERIQQEKNDTLRTNLTETLIKQLASAVEHGHVVCSTGKVTRIMSTLETIDDMVTAKPMWAIREEIATLAVKTREDFLAKLSKEQRETYDKGGASEYDDKMKSKFAADAKALYCSDLGMSESIIGPVIEQMSEGF
mgnify:CR=1 FL=1